MSTPLDAARAELRARQGSGARYDTAAAPATELSWARRGTAYFARLLNTLDDKELDAPSLALGWSRRHLIAHVGYHARALCRLLEQAHTGIEQPMYLSATARDAEIEFGATLPARALRSLFNHAEVHLNVEWRDLTDGQWDAKLATFQNTTIMARDTAWMRAREIWCGAVDLDNGGGFQDFPADMLDRLITDAIAKSDANPPQTPINLKLTDRSTAYTIGKGDGITLTGSAADIARWLEDRGAKHLVSSTGILPVLQPEPFYP